MMQDKEQWRRRRLALLAAEKGGKAALGRMLGYKDGAFVGQMIDGHRPITEKTIAAAEALPGARHWFDQTPTNMGAEEGQDTVKMLSMPPTVADRTDVVIPQYQTGGAMGHGVFLEEQPGIIKEWRVSEDWLRLNVPHFTAKKNLTIVTGFGPSMKPMFNPGDPLLVDAGVTTADSDGVYFFRIGTAGFVKQLQRIPQGRGIILRAKSYNPLYDPFDITPDMDFQVFGKVLTVWRSEQH